jgi:hypothetical protein
MRLKSSDEFVSTAWLAAFPIAVHQEAQNLAEGRIITTGNNYCSLLLLTLAELLTNHANHNRTVCYYQVTPVHPKDWYNWPHGNAQNPAYFENKYIGHYRRSLHAILLWAKQANKSLEHGRFFLAKPTKNEAGEITTTSSWSLIPDRSEFDSPSDFVFLGTALPFSEWKPSSCQFANELVKHFRSRVAQHFKTSEDDAGIGRKRIVPMWNKSWESKAGSRICNDLIRLAGEHQNNCGCAKEILKHAEGAQRKVLGSQIEIIKGLMGTKPQPKELQDLLEAFQDENHSRLIVRFPNHLQEYLRLQSSSALERDVKQALQIAWAEWLQLWETLQDKQGVWRPLLDSFAQNQQSDAGLAKIEVIDGAGQNRSEEIQQEFGIFGVRESVSNEIKWKLVLSTTLEYPFEIADIRVLERGTKAQLEKFQPYESLINELIAKKLPRIDGKP